VTRWLHPLCLAAWALGTLVALSPLTAIAGPVLDLGEGRDMELFFAVQFWDVYTFNAVDDDGNKVDDRHNLFIRRGRVGTTGHFQPRIRYLLTFAFDGIGLDAFSGNQGTPQAPDNQNFFLWDAFVTFALNRTWADLTVGYLRPQVGRESITSSLAVNSLVKTLNNVYPRQHIVGRGSGREMGFNLGGLYSRQNWSLNYNVGLYSTNHERIAGVAGGGSKNAALWTGRIAVSFGEPELEVYGIGYQVNFFDDRRGITLAINGTYQGETNQTSANDSDGEEVYIGGFRNNSLLGCDLLANLGQLSVSAEYDWLHREFDEAFAGSLARPTASKYTDTVWFMRAGYNFPLHNGQVLEPVLMYTRFDGDPYSAVFPDGQHEVFSAGMNWYLDRNKLKVNLHFHSHAGRPVSLFSDELGKEGDYAGAGLQMVF